LTELQRSLSHCGDEEGIPWCERNCYEDLISQMTCDDEGRHVLAAAVRANAEVVVTFNLRHFPQTSLEPYQITSVHPDDFLLDQLDLYPQATLQSLEDTSGRYEKPATCRSDFNGVEMTVFSRVLVGRPVISGLHFALVKRGSSVRIRHGALPKSSGRGWSPRSGRLPRVRGDLRP
jgi:hypothetical protein